MRPLVFPRLSKGRITRPKITLVHARKIQKIRKSGKMRVPLIILMIFFCALRIKLALANKDGFNIYKDLLRGKADEDEAAFVEANIRSPSKVVYFYRTPAQFGLTGNGGSIEDPNLGKRTMNKFKNYMLAKEMQTEIPHLSDKRGRSQGLPWTKNELVNIHCDQGRDVCWWQGAIPDVAGQK